MFIVKPYQYNFHLLICILSYSLQKHFIWLKKHILSTEFGGSLIKGITGVSKVSQQKYIFIELKCSAENSMTTDAKKLFFSSPEISLRNKRLNRDIHNTIIFKNLAKFHFIRKVNLLISTLF